MCTSSHGTAIPNSRKELRPIFFPSPKLAYLPKLAGAWWCFCAETRKPSFGAPWAGEENVWPWFHCAMGKNAHTIHQVPFSKVCACCFLNVDLCHAACCPLCQCYPHLNCIIYNIMYLAIITANIYSRDRFSGVQTLESIGFHAGFPGCSLFVACIASAVFLHASRMRLSFPIHL